MTLKDQSGVIISQRLTTERTAVLQGDSPMLGWFSIFMILTSRKSCNKRKQTSRQLAHRTTQSDGAGLLGPLVFNTSNHLNLRFKLILF